MAAQRRMTLDSAREWLAAIEFEIEQIEESGVGPAPSYLHIFRKWALADLRKLESEKYKEALRK